MATPDKAHGSPTQGSTDLNSTDSPRSSELRSKENDLFRRMIQNPPPMAPDLPLQAPPQVTPKGLPDAPLRSNFHSQEEFEEAMGYWQGHVGRIKGMVAMASRSKAPQPQ